MKIRTALPLIYALSFLMLSHASSSAQLNPAYPYGVSLSFDAASITHDLNQTTATPVTVRGSMQDVSGLGADNMTINITTAAQWVISTKVGGNAVHDGDIISLGSGQTLPIEVTFVTGAYIPDTESYCLSLSLSATYKLNHQCITLITFQDKNAAVTTDLPVPKVTIAPNPAENYIFAHGLTGEKAGYRYEIFSISGAEVRHGMLPADERINVQDLPSGAYRLLLFDAKQTISNTAFTVLH
jgi:hypothetical protein